MRRSLTVLVFLVLAALLGGSLAAGAATPNDTTCRKATISGSVSHEEIVAYDACRFDKLDAQVAALQQSSAPGSTSSPSATPSATPVVTPTPSSTPSPSPTTAPTGAALLDLPRVPWSGGAAAWRKYGKADAAGWDDPGFIPQIVWYGSCNADQTKFDAAHGLTTYAQCNPDTRAAQLGSMTGLFKPKEDNGPASKQVGVLLDDEVDGRYSDSDGIAYLKKLEAQHAPESSGLFSYVNYTSSIATYDRSQSNKAAWLNSDSVQNVISLDQYFYSNPQCSWTNEGQAFRYTTPSGGQSPITRSNCRTSSSYGKMIDILHDVQANADVPMKPAFGLVEVVSPGWGTQNGGKYVQPTGEQIKGAAWSSMIHGAAGIVWFSNSPDGGAAGNPCLSGDVLADARLSRGCPEAARNVEAMGQVNAQIKSFAPLLNTQSYAWNFGDGIDSALKVKDGSAYVFAMTKDGGAGSRTFTLPAGVRGASVEVMGEGRSLSVSAGKFVDTFAKESDVHVYRVSI